MTRARWWRVAAGFAVWLVVALALWPVLFTHARTETVVASHDAMVHPTLDGRVRLDLGPYLPDIRFPADHRIGVYVEVGKTTATSGAELAQRYASIAAHPEAEVARISGEVRSLALEAATRAALLALLPVLAWMLLGRERRAELMHVRPRVLGSVAALAAVAVVLVVEPWNGEGERVQPDDTWLAISDALPDVTVPAELDSWQLEGGLTTSSTRRLVQSAFDTYATSKVFYDGVAERVSDVADQLHPREDDQTVALLVSDRHDNIGMDAVARAIGDAGGATVLLDAGDDTSTGEEWESFSLDSLVRAFKTYDEKIAISGNHDNGAFVNGYLEKRGWTHLDGAVVEPFADVRVTGIDDPRSSGLGNWRDEKDLTFDEVKEEIADDVCADDAADKRVATLIVHDANLGATALARGCTDLVLAGHLHVQKGPSLIQGENGKAGYSYTNGTTGGAAYAIALGSKLRREAEVTLVTYQDGRPVGIQPVRIETTGDLLVEGYVQLDLG